MKNGIKLTARVDYNLIPKNDRLLDHSTVTDDPYFIIRQEKLELLQPVVEVLLTTNHLTQQIVLSLQVSKLMH